MKKLLKHKMAVIGGIILFSLYFIALFAGFFAPYSFNTETRQKAYHIPTTIHFDPKPYIYDYKMEFFEGKKSFTPIIEKKYYIRFFTNWKLLSVDEPAKLFILGADWNGRDILSRIIYGSRISLSIGLIGVTISLILGLFIGGLSGYFGGKTDNITMRIVELLMCFPSFYLMLALRAVFPLTMPSIAVYIMVIIILSLLGWPGLARVIRGMILSLKEREYILATKALGGNTPRILIKHLLPQTVSYTIVAASLSIPSYILGESALSLLGLGIMEPYASWGNMLSRAMSISDIQFHPWILWPGFFIFITVMAFNFLGDGLRDILDPRAVITGSIKKRLRD
jgi:peptide/nickel transport system permease protein